MRERERKRDSSQKKWRQTSRNKQTFEYPQEAQPDWDFENHAQNDCLVLFVRLMTKCNNFILNNR